MRFLKKISWCYYCDHTVCSYSEQSLGPLEKNASYWNLVERHRDSEMGMVQMIQCEDGIIDIYLRIKSLYLILKYWLHSTAISLISKCLQSRACSSLGLFFSNYYCKLYTHRYAMADSTKANSWACVQVTQSPKYSRWLEFMKVPGSSCLNFFL